MKHHGRIAVRDGPGGWKEVPGLDYLGNKKEV